MYPDPPGTTLCKFYEVLILFKHLMSSTKLIVRDFIYFYIKICIIFISVFGPIHLNTFTTPEGVGIDLE